MSSGQYRNDEHVCAHEKRAAKQCKATTNAISNEQDEEETCYDLDNAEKAAEQESVIACADSFEDLRCD